MGGTSALVIGFSFAGYNSWRSPRTLGLLISGVCALILAAIWETFQPNPSNALVPSGIFRKLTIVNILVISILHNFAFTAGTYYIPLYYQALHGTSPLVAGMQVLPFSLGAALATIPTAWFISWRPGYQWIDRTLKICIALGLALSAVGYGTFVQLRASFFFCSSLLPIPTHMSVATAMFHPHHHHTISHCIHFLSPLLCNTKGNAIYMDLATDAQPPGKASKGQPPTCQTH
jgi:hypothetical protein